MLANWNCQQEKPKRHPISPETIQTILASVGSSEKQAARLFEQIFSVRSANVSSIAPGTSSRFELFSHARLKQRTFTGDGRPEILVLLVICDD